MFRSPEYCDRYEYIPIQLDTPITTPEYLAATRIAMINDAASLIADMQVKQNSKTVYDSNNLHRVTNIKNLQTMSQDYANSSATSEYFYLNTGDTTIKDGDDANYNKGFTIRSALVLSGKIQNPKFNNSIK